MAFEIGFWIVAVLSVGAALAVVLLRDIFRAALFLVLCFFTVAGVYITLNAEFLAAVQILIYVGAIAVLIIFAIMLTREPQRGSPSGRLRIPAFIIALLLLGAMVGSMLSVDAWHIATKMPEMVATGDIAQAIFSEEGFILPFEIAAVLLLAAVIGAIVMLREKK